MSGVELALGIVGALGVVDVAIKYTKVFIDTCSNYNNAERELGEGCVRLRSNCIQMKLQLDILHKVWNHLDEETQEVQDEVLEILKLKISAVNAKLKGFLASHSSTSSEDQVTQAARTTIVISRLKKSKYAILKNYLDIAITDMEKWQTTLFNPSWFTFMKLGSQQLDIELRQAVEEKSPNKESDIITGALAIRNPLRKAGSTHVFLPSSKLERAETVEIAFSSVRLIQIENETKWYLLDCVYDLSKKQVRDLAVTLKKTDPSTFGLLTCLGAVHNEPKHEFLLVFRIPKNTSNPETLRARLLSKDSSHSLSDRFDIATQLARAICSVHTFGMVHKSIQPESIFLFRDQETTLGSAFLLGFEQVRMDESPTRLIGDANWEKNLYRHPHRQGDNIKARYIMQHDIYSLGVCLLEIGLWRSFVEYPGSDPAKPEDFSFHGDEPDNEIRSELVKNELLFLAKTELREKMGTKYSEIVQTCLTCLDLGNGDFGDESEFQDEDGITVAVKYIEKVVLRNLKREPS